MASCELRIGNVLRHTRTMSSFQPFEQAMQALTRRIASRNLLHESLVMRLLHHVATQASEALDAPLRPHGLNTTLWTSLLVIYGAEGHRLRPSDLSVFMNSSRTNSTRVANALTQLGYVSREPSMEDGRQYFLQLTPTGKTLVADNLPSRREYVRHMLDNFTEQDMDELERLLRRLSDTLDNLSAKRPSPLDDETPT